MKEQSLRGCSFLLRMPCDVSLRNGNNKILTAGEYRQNLSGLDERIGITVLHISAAAGYVNAESGNGCEIIEIPAGIDNQETYRIRC